MKWARLSGLTALEVITFDPAGRYVPSVAALFEPVEDDCVGGATLVEGRWIAPQQPESAPPQAPFSQVPEEVTMRQAQTALLKRGFLSQVNAAVQALPGEAGDVARIDWARSTVVRRDWPLVAQMRPLLGLTEEQMDELFIFAATL